MKKSTSLIFFAVIGTIWPGILYANERPNILYINADDLGVMDVGYNNPLFLTPNIDRLADEGMVFTEAYAPAANCAPSRACVHSGQWGPRHGVYTVGGSERGKATTRKLIPVKNTKSLPPEMITMAEALKAGGYRTIHAGKYHVSRDPLQDGFDVNIGGDHTGSPAGGYYSPWKRGSMQEWSDTVPPNTHRIDVYVREVKKFIQENKGEPLFIHFSPYLVHTPITAVPEYLDHYQGKINNPKYGSMVEKFDEAVGSVLASLEEEGLAENTLVVFCSDNGGIADIQSQAPYRAGKGSYYEGGVREPMIMRWPGKIKAGSTTDEIVNSIDFYPTFLEAAGLPIPEGKILDGYSLMPLMLQTGGWDSKVQYWHFPIYLQAYSKENDDGRDPLFRTRPGSTLRVGKWKLHEYFEDGGIELYDLSADPGERNDLSKEFPEKTKELHAMMLEWRDRTDAPVPTELNPKYEGE